MIYSIRFQLTRQMSELSTEKYKLESQLSRIQLELDEAQKEKEQLKETLEEVQKQLEEVCPVLFFKFFSMEGFLDSILHPVDLKFSKS